MLGQLTREQKAHGSLDLSRRDRGPLVVVSKTGSLGSDSLEDVVDEAVHDAHGLAGHTGVRVHLLQDLVDVDGVRLPPPALALLVRGPRSFGLCRCLLATLRCNTLGRHVYSEDKVRMMKNERVRIYIRNLGLTY